MLKDNYVHDCEMDLFRIPRVMMTDEKCRGPSTDAKLLCGIMLDRMGLTIQNGWLDGQGRAFLYFTQKVQDVLSCGHNKAVRLMPGLEK